MAIQSRSREHGWIGRINMDFESLLRHESLRHEFPLLNDTNYEITSRATGRYNCIAWAAGKCNQKWWPEYRGYWPPGLKREVTLEAFVAMFETLGYEKCENIGLERGFEKVVIYVEGGRAQIPTHAARQLENGSWTSKLGDEVDIEHLSPDILTSDRYGRPHVYMRRPRST